VSEYAGFDGQDVQIVDTDLETLKSSLIHYSQRPGSWIDEMSEKNHQLTKTTYSRHRYSNVLQKIFLNLLS